MMNSWVGVMNGFAGKKSALPRLEVSGLRKDCKNKVLEAFMGFLQKWLLNSGRS